MVAEPGGGFGTYQRLCCNMGSRRSKLHGEPVGLAKAFFIKILIQPVQWDIKLFAAERFCFRNVYRCIVVQYITG